MKRFVIGAALGLFCGMLTPGHFILAQTSIAPQTTGSATQGILDQSAASGKFTFLVFYKEETPAVRAMAQVARDGVTKREDKAVLAYVQASNPAERALIERFDVGRAPMPLTLVVAPNGAITGVFAKQLQDDNLDAAIVTPTMMHCMKSLQENRLVFVCVQTGDQSLVPVAIQEMQVDPQFKDRVVLVSIKLRDPSETRFLEQMQIDPEQVKGTTAVLLAPPGVLIGKYDAASTAAQIAAALHHAGKCCDDPNCKHNQGTTQQSAQPASRRN